ncbi:hypothetical protein [Shinella zoogloeoides]|uniref:hypothetical protein n=1 Tax=Shinella zoogloeoides TaxID=352475 RepID=UPI001F58E31A|nr:hypothetical protein [Shinella zoogloeoides]
MTKLANFDGLLDLWGTLDARINRMLTSQPAEMTASAEKLEAARIAFGDAIRAAMRSSGGDQP